MLADVLPYLRCPVCRAPIDAEPSPAPRAARAEPSPAPGAVLRCRGGHAYDVARQGYVNLLTGRPPAGADTPAMVAARCAVHAAGHLDRLVERVTTAAIAAANTSPAAAVAAATASPAAAGPTGLVIDAGAGPGHYLAAVVDRLGGAVGLALDSATAAVRRAARAHPRVGAAVCDVWRGLPVADGCADLVLDVFAPRNPPEFHRVLDPAGVLLVVTPSADHLAELVAAFGLLAVDPSKQGRLAASVGRWFRLDRRTAYREIVSIGRDDAARLAAMGPSAFHTGAAELARRARGLDPSTSVTLSVELGIYRPVGRPR